MCGFSFFFILILSGLIYYIIIKVRQGLNGEKGEISLFEFISIFSISIIFSLIIAYLINPWLTYFILSLFIETAYAMGPLDATGGQGSSKIFKEGILNSSSPSPNLGPESPKAEGSNTKRPLPESFEESPAKKYRPILPKGCSITDKTYQPEGYIVDKTYQPEGYNTNKSVSKQANPTVTEKLGERIHFDNLTDDEMTGALKILEKYEGKKLNQISQWKGNKTRSKYHDTDFMCVAQAHYKQNVSKYNNYPGKTYIDKKFIESYKEFINKKK